MAAAADTAAMLSSRSAAASPASTQRRLAICMVCDFVYPRLGGVEMHIWSLAQGLIKMGHKVIIVTNLYNTANGRRVGIRTTTNGLKFYYLPAIAIVDQATMPSYYAFLPLFRRILIRERIDIVHGHSATSPLMHECLLQAKAMGYKCVFTDHSLFGFADAASINVNKYVKFTLSGVDHCICVSHTDRENLVLRAALDPRMVSTIPNAVDASKFTPDPSARPASKQLNIVMLSRLVYRKGIDLVVNVIPTICARFPEVHFIIGGDGPKKLLLEEMRERHQLHDRVELLGAVPHKNVRDVLIRGHIFLNCSLTEAFCIAILEAACCGCFCVSTRVGGVPEVLPLHMIKFADPEPESLVRAIGEAIPLCRFTDPIAFHAQLKDSYNWPEVAQRTLTVYNSVLATPSPPLIERFRRYCGVGRIFGPIAVIAMVLFHFMVTLLEFVAPAWQVDIVPDLPLPALDEAETAASFKRDYASLARPPPGGVVAPPAAPSGPSGAPAFVAPAPPGFWGAASVPSGLGSAGGAAGGGSGAGAGAGSGAGSLLPNGSGAAAPTASGTSPAKPAGGGGGGRSRVSSGSSATLSLTHAAAAQLLAQLQASTGASAAGTGAGGSDVASGASGHSLPVSSAPSAAHFQAQAQALLVAADAYPTFTRPGARPSHVKVSTLAPPLPHAAPLLSSSSVSASASGAAHAGAAQATAASLPRRGSAVTAAAVTAGLAAAGRTPPRAAATGPYGAPAASSAAGAAAGGAGVGGGGVGASDGSSGGALLGRTGGPGSRGGLTASGSPERPTGTRGTDPAAPTSAGFSAADGTAVASSSQQPFLASAGFSAADGTAAASSSQQSFLASLQEAERRRAAREARTAAAAASVTAAGVGSPHLAGGGGGGGAVGAGIHAGSAPGGGGGGMAHESFALQSYPQSGSDSPSTGLGTGTATTGNGTGTGTGTGTDTSASGTGTAGEATPRSSPDTPLHRPFVVKAGGPVPSGSARAVAGGEHEAAAGFALPGRLHTDVDGSAVAAAGSGGLARHGRGDRMVAMGAARGLGGDSHGSGDSRAEGESSMGDSRAEGESSFTPSAGSGVAGGGSGIFGSTTGGLPRGGSSSGTDDGGGDLPDGTVATSAPAAALAARQRRRVAAAASGNRAGHYSVARELRGLHIRTGVPTSDYGTIQATPMANDGTELGDHDDGLGLGGSSMSGFEPVSEPPSARSTMFERMGFGDSDAHHPSSSVDGTGAGDGDAGVVEASPDAAAAGAAGASASSAAAGSEQEEQ